MICLIRVNELTLSGSYTLYRGGPLDGRRRSNAEGAETRGGRGDRNLCVGTRFTKIICVSAAGSVQRITSKK